MKSIVTFRGADGTWHRQLTATGIAKLAEAIEPADPIGAVRLRLLVVLRKGRAIRRLREHVSR